MMSSKSSSSSSENSAGNGDNNSGKDEKKREMDEFTGDEWENAKPAQNLENLNNAQKSKVH